MEKAQVTIRHGTPGDSALLAEIGARAFADTFGPDNTPENMAAYLAESFSPARQAAELAEPGSLFLIAEAAGETAGYARLHAGPPPASALSGAAVAAAGAAASGQRPIEIVRFYALPGWVGRGVGAALMAACLAEAERLGADTIWLDVWEHNPRAREFYARWGFAEVGTQTFVLGDDRQRDILMQRPVKLAAA